MEAFQFKKAKKNPIIKTPELKLIQAAKRRAAKAKKLEKENAQKRKDNPMMYALAEASLRRSLPAALEQYIMAREDQMLNTAEKSAGEMAEKVNFISE